MCSWWIKYKTENVCWLSREGINVKGQIEVECVALFTYCFEIWAMSIDACSYIEFGNLITNFLIGI